MVKTLTRFDNINIGNLFAELDKRGLKRTPSRNFLNHFFYRNQKYMFYYDSDSNRIDFYVVPRLTGSKDGDYGKKYVEPKFDASYVESYRGKYRRIATSSIDTGVTTVSNDKEMDRLVHWLFSE